MKERIIKDADRAKQEIEKYFGLFLSVAISNRQDGMEGIPIAYAQALEVIEYIILVGESDTVVDYSLIQQSEYGMHDDSFEAEKEKQLINFIKSKNYIGADEILKSIIVNYFQNNIQSLQIMKCRMFGLINLIIHALGDMQNSCDIEFLEELDPTNRLLKVKSIVELQKETTFIFRKLMEYYDTNGQEQSLSWIAEVTEYVNLHYHDTNLNISMIADLYHLNISYLSRTYKKQTGEGLLDYLQKVRIEKVKELMKSRMSLKEIAEKTGYLESKTMIRTFKRYEGITPGRYRDIKN